MNYRNILPLVSHTQAFSTDYWNDFGYWNDGTFWYEKTPTYTARVTAYATATGITDYTILDPLNIFDLGLTYYGLDTIMKALYPMVTDKTSQSDMANQMKYNFMNPLDTNAAFRLQWVGGWIYSRTGALPNGTNAYADTSLNPSVALVGQQNNMHVSYYSRTNINGNMDIGLSTWTPPYTYMYIRISNLIASRFNTGNAENSTSNTNSLGLFILNRTLSTSLTFFRNGNPTVLSQNSTGISNGNILLGGNTAISDYSNKQCAFASIGNGLTDFQADIFSTLVNNLQKELNRAVY